MNNKKMRCHSWQDCKRCNSEVNLKVNKLTNPIIGYLLIITFFIITLNTSSPAAGQTLVPPRDIMYITQIERNESYLIETNFSIMFDPLIYEDNIVFVTDAYDVKNITNHSRIYANRGEYNMMLYNLSSKKFTNIGPGIASDIWDNYLVYSFNETNYPYQVIKIYNILTNDTITIKGEEDFFYPKIYQNKIVWKSGPQLYLYNMSNNSYFPIIDLSSPNSKILTVDFFGNFIVFDTMEGYDDGLYTIANLYLYDITNDTLMQLDLDEKHVVSPRIWDEHLVWVDIEDTNKWNIILLNITTMERNVLTRLPRGFLDITENYVIWSDLWADDGNGTTLTIYNLTSKTQFSIYLDEFNNGGSSFDIYGSTAVWISYANRDIHPPPKDIVPVDNTLSYSLFLPLPFWIATVALIVKFSRKMYITREDKQKREKVLKSESKKTNIILR